MNYHCYCVNHTHLEMMVKMQLTTQHVIVLWSIRRINIYKMITVIRLAPNQEATLDVSRGTSHGQKLHKQTQPMYLQYTHLHRLLYSFISTTVSTCHAEVITLKLTLEVPVTPASQHDKWWHHIYYQLDGSLHRLHAQSTTGNPMITFLSSSLWTMLPFLVIQLMAHSRASQSTALMPHLVCLCILTSPRWLPELVQRTAQPTVCILCYYQMS